ncbi:ABC transporter substrate-binding protein [Bosea massiliensis]|uniref:ABC transporter substrate-binding protein n=1 Tax=Bosea massiliensis TaxID=151419 RepID=A0ABW0P7H2_9HYPH
MSNIRALAASRRQLLLGSAASALVATMAFPALAQSAPGTPKRGGALTLAVSPEPTTLVALTTTGGSERKLSAKVIEGLLSYDEKLDPKPQLATAWSIDPTGTRYTFTLRQGVRWHDGKNFTAEDVAASIRILQKSHPRGRTVFQNVTDIEIADPHTVTIVLSKPAPYLLYALAASESPIVPAHLYKDGDVQKNRANTAPVGTGPYRFSNWVRGSHATFVRNPDYWDTSKPHIDRLTVRFIPDAGARAAALEAGEVDLASENPVPLADLDRLRKLPNLTATSEGYTYNANGRRLEFNLDNPYLADAGVRQAVAHAINRVQLAEVVYLGYASPVVSPISPLLARFHTNDIEQYGFDVARAEKLLDEAGYPRKEGGARFSLPLDYNPYASDYGAVANFLRDALDKIGIRVTVRAQDFGSYVRRIFTERDFAFHVTGMSNLFDPTVGVQRIYWSQSFKPGVPFSNGSHYSNVEVDRLLEAAAIEPDEAKRRDLFVEFQKIVSRDIPVVNLVTIQEFTVGARKVRDHSITADGVNGNFADVWIAQ